MIYSQQLTLESDNLTYEIGNISPLELTIILTDISVDKKIRAIEYCWYDGTIDYISYKPSASRLPLESGDPRNFPQTKIFTNTKTVSSFNNTINVYRFGTDELITFNINIKLYYPTISFRSINDFDPFFSNFNLIKTKMFGLDNNILYTFEGDSNPYILMTMVNWKKRPEEPISTKKLNKIFNISEPYSKNFSNNPSVSATTYSLLSNTDNTDTISTIFP
jgi:hypothetical protein